MSWRFLWLSRTEKVYRYSPISDCIKVAAGSRVAMSSISKSASEAGDSMWKQVGHEGVRSIIGACQFPSYASMPAWCTLTDKAAPLCVTDRGI